MDTKGVGAEALLGGVEREVAACHLAARQEDGEGLDRHAHALLDLARTLVDLVETCQARPTR